MKVQLNGREEERGRGNARQLLEKISMIKADMKEYKAQ